jgi:hypothetical protein
VLYFTGYRPLESRFHKVIVLIALFPMFIINAKNTVCTQLLHTLNKLFSSRKYMAKIKPKVGNKAAMNSNN